MTKEDILDRCVKFSIKINNLRKELREKQHEYNNSDQIQRSGTSIGANYSEACCAESKADFVHKLAIAHKEAFETIYWLKVLVGSKLITEEKYNELLGDVDELSRILSASIKTMRTIINDSNGCNKSTISNQQSQINNLKSSINNLKSTIYNQE